MCYLPIESLARIIEAHTGRTQEAHFPEPIIQDQALAGSLLRLHRCLASGDNTLDPLEASEQQVSCFGSLVARYGNAQIHDREATPGKIRQALELLHNEPSIRVTIEELAARVHLSPYHLIRSFRRHVGLPPHAYLKQMRIARAQCFLRAGLSITDAAFAAGFSDQSHLTREFRRTLGLTPGQYVSAQPARRGIAIRRASLDPTLADRPSTL